MTVFRVLLIVMMTGVIVSKESFIAETCAGGDGVCQSVDDAVAGRDGEWKDVLLYDDGAVYSGDMENGVPEGAGREESADGHRYDGEWEGGMKSGAGKYTWKDGRSYKGCPLTIHLYFISFILYQANLGIISPMGWGH